MKPSLDEDRQAWQDYYAPTDDSEEGWVAFSTALFIWDHDGDEPTDEDVDIIKAERREWLEEEKARASPPRSPTPEPLDVPEEGDSAATL